jgi:hypothetical protein
MRYRFARIEDFSRCLDLIHNSLTDRPDLRQRLPEIWTSLFRAGRLLAAVIEDDLLPESEQLQAIYLAVFITDAYVEELLSCPRPRVVLRLYERILAGDSPVLTPEEIRAANSGTGLNCLMLHTGMRHLGASGNHRLAESLRDVCVLLHAGYRTRFVVEEVLGVRARVAMEQSGFRLVTDFGDYYNGATPPADDHPYFFVASAAEQHPGIVSGCSFYFNCGEPQFDFAPVQQQVLLHALFNESDEEIAASLDISIETVRKHWRSIYRHVLEVKPGLFPGERSDGDARGPEKRRYLLSHLRMHLDEVRPRLRTRRRRPRSLSIAG